MVLEKFHECWLCDYHVTKQTEDGGVKQTEDGGVIHWCCWHDKETSPNGLCLMYTRY